MVNCSPLCLSSCFKIIAISCRYNIRCSVTVAVLQWRNIIGSGFCRTVYAGWPKKNFTSYKISHIFLKAKFTNKNKVSACSWKAPLSFEMLLGQFKICLLSEKAISKILKFIHFSDHSLAFQVWKKLNSNLLWSMKFEWGTEVNNFANKNFLRQLLIHRYFEFSSNVDWKMMVIISLKMRNPGF